MSLIIILGLAAVVSASDPPTNCISHTLSGVMLTVQGTHKHGATLIDVHDDVIEFHYDWDSKITAVTLHSLNMTTGTRYRTTSILDYKFGTNYIIAGDGKCYRQDLDPNSIQSPCFTSNFVYRGTKTVGYGSEGVRVTIFEGSYDNDMVTVLATDDSDHFPVTYLGFGEHGEVRRMHAYLYTNLQKTVNRELFNIPRHCMNAPKIPATRRAAEDITGLHIRVPF